MSLVWCGHPASSGGAQMLFQESQTRGVRLPSQKLLPPACDLRNIWAALWLGTSLSALSPADGPLSLPLMASSWNVALWVSIEGRMSPRGQCLSQMLPDGGWAPPCHRMRQPPQEASSLSIRSPDIGI